MENNVKDDGLRNDTGPIEAAAVPVNDWRKFAVLCFVSYFYYQPLAVMTYIQNEWIQHTMKEKYFPDSEFSNNISSCNNPNHSTVEYQMYTKVQQDSAQWNIFINISINVTAFIANLILPCYTDTYGRRFLFIIATAGYLIKTVVICLNIYFKQNLAYIVLANGIEGTSGSKFAYLSVTFSYVADIFRFE